MKKLICAVLLTAVVTRCSAKEEKVPENGVKIKDIFVCIDENFNQVKNHLDEVLTVSAQASCIYPGDEKIYLQAKRTPSIGAFGYHRTDGDEFAPYLLS